MPTYHNNIPPLVQRAIVAYLQAETLSFLEPEKIFTSILDESATVPNVLVKCQTGKFTNTQESNLVARAMVELRESADDTTADEHFDHAGELFAQFATATIADDLSAALADFACQQVVRVETGWFIDGRLWVSFLELELQCCGSELG